MKKRKKSKEKEPMKSKEDKVKKSTGKNEEKKVEGNSDKQSKSSIIHETVLSMIRDLGYSEEESKIIKAGLYKYTKDTHPELNNYERALKMKGYVTLNHIKKIDIEAMKKAIKIHKESKIST